MSKILQVCPGVVFTLPVIQYHEPRHTQMIFRQVSIGFSFRKLCNLTVLFLISVADTMPDVHFMQSLLCMSKEMENGKCRKMNDLLM